MENREALIVLIQHSFMLSDEVKAKLLSRIDSISEEDSATLGKFLAQEKEGSISENEIQLGTIDAVLEKIDEEEKLPA